MSIDTPPRERGTIAMSTVFNTPYEQHADRDGQTVDVVRIFTEPDATHDLECLPMVQVRFPDGFIGEAFPEELTPDPTVTIGEVKP